MLEGGGVGVQVLKILGVDTNHLFQKVLQEIRLKQVKIPRITATRKIQMQLILLPVQLALVFAVYYVPGSNRINWVM